MVQDLGGAGVLGGLGVSHGDDRQKRKAKEDAPCWSTSFPTIDPYKL